ncbi:MAG TPA: GSCFA domain-containing protein, partial [Brevundimonas sp.]
GLEYPSCPGIIAGEYSQDRYVFHNQTMAEVMETMDECFHLLQSLRPGLRILLTVSPVPLTATKTGDHVLVASTHSKSVLRAVAGELTAREMLYDYFPSYEIITAPAFRGYFFAPNMREVSPRGVDFVMTHFLPHLLRVPVAAILPPASVDPVCDEMVLDRYAAP